MSVRWITSGIIMLLLSGVVAQAETIVDFTHVDGTHTIRIADADSLSGDTWNFSDSTLLLDGAEIGNDSNTKIYGGLLASWNNTNYTPNLQLRNSDDRLQLQVNAGTSAQGLEGMLIWNKDDFSNHSTNTVVFDAESSMRLTMPIESGSTTVRFVVNSGGIYYVSNTSTNNAGTMTLNDPGSDTWAPIYTNDYSIGTYAVRTFSDIRGAGIYLNQSANGQTIFQLSDFQVSASTPEIYRVDNYGASPNDDSDNDGDAIQNCIDDALNYAKNNGPAVVRFSPGTYHISDQQRFFVVSRKTGQDCLIIDGNGCTLMNTHAAPMGLNFRVSLSENVTLRNMTIRSQNCMWVEGEIVTVNGDGTYDVQLRSDSPAFNAWGPIEQGREIDSYGFAWPCAKGLYCAPPIGGKSHVFVTTANDLGGGRWQVTGFDDGVTGVGDTYAMWNDWTHWVDDVALGKPTDYQSFFLDKSSNVELQDITLMAGSKMAMRSTSSSNIVIHGFKTLPDGDRAVAMARDGLNFHDSGNVLVRGCIVGFNGDDTFNGGDEGHNGSNMVIEDSLFCYSRRHVALNPIDNFIFRNNIVYYVGGSLLVLHEGNAPKQVLMANNEVYSGLRNPSWDNIELLDYSNVTITNNRLFNCKYSLLDAVDGDQLVFENNHFDREERDSASYIAKLNNATNTTLKGNTTATADDAVLVKGSTTLTSGSQTSFGRDTAPEFDHARVLAMLEVIPEVPAVSVEVVANMGVNATGFSGGMNSASYPAGSSSSFNHVYDLSNLDLGVDTLELLVTSSGSGGNIYSAGGFGLTTDGAVSTGGLNWWDVGEDFDVSVSLKKGEVDVTSAFSVDLTGFAMRWTDRDMDANPDTAVTVTVAGESQTPSSTGAAAVEAYALSVGETNETAFSAVRTQAYDIAQLGQLRFQLSNDSASPSPPPVDIGFANIFADGCVLQRGQTVPVWGTATPGDTITLEINGQSKQGLVDGQGNWRIELDPETAGGPYTLTTTGSVSGPAELMLVYFGDVWIMTGQSNMEQNLSGQVSRFPDDYPAVPDNSDNFDDMRFAIVDVVTTNTPADDVTMARSWGRWQKNTLGQMSTVGYFFARKLNEQLDANGMVDVPLGFIKVTKGGTAIEEWISEDQVNAAKVANPGLVVASDASGYYNGMMAPIQGYAVKGAIWYQGEGNTASMTRIEQYPILKQTLVDSWREQWNNPDMPFYFVQLAPYKAYTPLPVDELWAWMRESQESCQSIPNTAMACIIDGGHQGEIHPPFKDRVGDRLARLALDRTYGIAMVHRGPTLQDIAINGAAATITFDHVASGLETRANDSQPDADEMAEGYRTVSASANELAGFFLCGADAMFYPAVEATITANNQVRISNPVDVPSPVAVRYAFQNYPRCNLFNSEGLPAEPFRTDDYAFGEAQAETNGYAFWKYDTFSPMQLAVLLTDPAGDPDKDGMSLFEEYAFGGNPLLHDAATARPKHDLAADHIYYIHNERTDDEQLKYSVQLTSNLVSNDWNSVGLEFVGESGELNNVKAVTNRTNIGSTQFFRLKVESQ